MKKQSSEAEDSAKNICAVCNGIGDQKLARGNFETG